MLQSLLTKTVQYTNTDRILILNSAADPCIAALARQLTGGELLLAEDSVAAWAQAQTTLQQMGKSAPRFRQVAFHEYTLHETPATIDVAILNILYQPNNAWMHYALQLAAYALKSGGRFYIEGAKDRGILSLGKRVQDLFGNLETCEISKGHRVICAVKGAHLQSEIEPLRQAAFARGKLDEGTELLLAHLDVHVTDIALDLGCGAGFIGAFIAERASKGQVTLLDASLASVSAAQTLLEERGLSAHTRVRASDGAQAVRGERFDLIATNPPFHIGGIQTTAVAERFIREAATLLRPRGRFYLVANRFLKYEPTLRASFSQVEEIAGNGRFKVLRASGSASQPEDETDGEVILFKLQ
jgi:16S rRNA (guanine1207-N2)-methyltransferase